MPILSSTFRPLVLALMLAVPAGSLNAAPAKPAPAADGATDKSKKIQPAGKLKFSEAELAAEIERRTKVLQRTQSVFTLLGAEMALNKGDIASAIGVYLLVLRDTKDPEVAERAMELAINARAYRIAEQIYQKWREIEPEPGPAQRRLAWVRALAVGDTASVVSGLGDVLKEAANDNQRKRIFLLLSQISVANPQIADVGAEAVHNAAKNYPEMPEAVIADVLYNTGKDRESKALDALQRLAKLDGDMTPATKLALEVVSEKHPELIGRFFRQHDSRKMPEAWRKIEIVGLIKSGQYDEAYARLEQMLGETPKADLYMQAAAISISRKDKIEVALNHLERAYQTGTADEKSRAAIIAAIRLIAEKRYAEAERWLDRVTAPEYRFDQSALRISLANENKNWQRVRTLAEEARKLPVQRGLFFDSADLESQAAFAIARGLPHKEAEAELSRQIAYWSKQPDAKERTAILIYHRGLLYSDHMGQPEKAVADFRRYIRMNPGNPAGPNALGYTMLGMPKADVAEAFKLIQSAYRMDSENPSINDSMGWAYFKRGDAEAALPYLEFAYEQEPSAEVAAHLGEVYWTLGKKDKARTVWEAALKEEPDDKILQETLQRLRPASAAPAAPSSKPE